MSARIFVHPRCTTEPAFSQFANTLFQHGFDLKTVKIGPLVPGHHRELVRQISESGVNQEFERMDGTRFMHRMGQIHDTTEAA